MTSSVEPLLTLADLEAFPEDDGNRYELIAGELFLSPAPGISHQLLLKDVQMELARYLRDHPIGILVPGTGLFLSDYDAVIPDICFVRNERWDEVVTGEKFTRAVDLVIEIISSGKENRERDLKFKRQLYAKYGVQEYWIVDRENQCVLIYHLRGNNLEEIAKLSDQDEITAPLLPGFQLKVSSIFNY
jgi:Uma2 family endonuclease